jgi:type I restriction enzyme M protein
LRQTQAEPAKPIPVSRQSLGTRGKTFLGHSQPNCKADYILANPPFNVSDWSGQLSENDVRWRFGKPPNGNANWIQHFIDHLAVPSGRGVACPS